MSESPPAVWQMLPQERRRGVVVTLGQMALRQLRHVSLAEETFDDRRGSCAASKRHHAGKNPPAAPRTPRNRLHSAIDSSASRTSSGVDATAIRVGLPRPSIWMVSPDDPAH